MKMAKWSSEEFQKVSELSCEYLSDSFPFVLLSSDAVSLCFHLHSLAWSCFSRVDRVMDRGLTSEFKIGRTDECIINEK